MTAFRLTRAAERDIDLNLRDTVKMFGTRQKTIYRDIIKDGAALVAEIPDRSGAWLRDDILPGLRSFHLELAAGRRGAATHCLYYVTRPLPDGTVETIVLRVLHETMEPRLHIVRAADDSP